MTARNAIKLRAALARANEDALAAHLRRRPDAHKAQAKAKRMLDDARREAAWKKEIGARQM